MFSVDYIGTFFHLLAECGGLVGTILKTIEKLDVLDLANTDAYLNVLNDILSAGAYLGMIWLNWAISVMHDASIVQLDEASIIGAWRQIIFFVNVFALFMLIAIALLNALRINIQTYAVKKTLPNLVAGIIMANLSYLFCLALLDLNDVLSSFFLYTAGGPEKVVSDIVQLLLGQDPKVLGFEIGKNVGSLPEDIVCNYTGLIMAALGIGVGLNPSADALKFVLIGLVFVTIVFLFLPALLFGLLAIILLARRLVVFVLIALAPLGFLFYFFPATRGLGEKWLNTFIQWVFMPAVIFFILSIGTIFVGVNFNLLKTDTGSITDNMPWDDSLDTIGEAGDNIANETNNSAAQGIWNLIHATTPIGPIYDVAEIILDATQKTPLIRHINPDKFTILNQQNNTLYTFDLNIIDTAFADDPPADPPADPPGGGSSDEIDFGYFIQYIFGLALVMAAIYTPFTTGALGSSIVNTIASFAGGPLAKSGMQALSGFTGISGLEGVLPQAATKGPSKAKGISKDLLGLTNSALTSGSQKASPMDLANQWNFLRTPQAQATYGGPEGVRQQMTRTNQMRKEFFDQEMLKQAGKGSNDLIGQLNALDKNGDVSNFLNGRPLKDPSKLNEIGALMKTLDNKAKSNADPSQYLPARKYIEENAGHTNKFFEGSPESLNMSQFESVNKAIDNVIKDPATNQTLKQEFANTGSLSSASSSDINQIMVQAKANFGEQPWTPVTEGGRQLTLDDAHKEFKQSVGQQMLNNYKANSGAVNNKPLRLIKKQITAGDYDAAIKTANANNLGGMATHMKGLNSADRMKFTASLDNMIENNDLVQNQTPISMKASDHMSDIMSKLEEAKSKNSIDDINKYTAQSNIVGYHQSKIDALKQNPTAFDQVKTVIKNKGGNFSSQKDIDLQSILSEIPKSVNKEYVQQIMPEVKVTNYENPYENVANSPDIESLLKTRLNYIAQEDKTTSTTPPSFNPTPQTNT